MEMDIILQLALRTNAKLIESKSMWEKFWIYYEQNSWDTAASMHRLALFRAYMMFISLLTFLCLVKKSRLFFTRLLTDIGSFVPCFALGVYINLRSIWLWRLFIRYNFGNVAYVHLQTKSFFWELIIILWKNVKSMVCVVLHFPVGFVSVDPQRTSWRYIQFLLSGLKYISVNIFLRLNFIFYFLFLCFYLFIYFAFPVIV
jgi:hypothetical protein